MEKTNKKKEANQISLQIETNFGKLTGVFDLADVERKFRDEFDKYLEVSNGCKHYFFATEHAEDLLKELLPPILEDALNQVWSEVKAKTLLEFNNKPCFLIYDSTGDNNIETVEIFALPKKEIKNICDEIAEKAKKDSHQRMRTEELSKRGGNKSKKLSNHDFIHLDEIYSFYYLQAKSILDFYEWQKELANLNFDDWNKHFLDIMFQPTRKDNEFLFEKLDDPNLTEKEKTKYENILNSKTAILCFKDNEIELWKNTFQRILATNFNQQEIMTFETLSPEKLTYHYLATIFQDKYNTEFSSDTIAKNVQEIRRIKRELLKE